MESSRTVTNKPNSRMAALKRKLTRRRRYVEQDDFSKLPGRAGVIKDTIKMKTFPQGRNKLLCDNNGSRSPNGYKAQEPYEMSYPGEAQFRPEVIADNIKGVGYAKPRNTFIVKK